jgi:hypothetical protein
LHKNRRNNARTRSFDWHFHFHGFKDHDDLAWSNRVSNFNVDLPDRAGDVCFDAGGHCQFSVDSAVAPVKFQANRTMTRQHRLCRFAAIGALWLLPVAAQAHPETSPGLVNRYVQLVAHGANAEISVALLYGEQPALVLRRSADSNRNGTLDPIEMNHLKNALQAQAGGWLRLQHQGRPMGFAPTVSLDLGNNQAVGASPLVVEARMTLSLVESVSHIFAIEPTMDPDYLGETEISCAVGPGWFLSSSSTPKTVGTERSYKSWGRLPAGWQTQFTLRRTEVTSNRIQLAKLSALALSGLSALGLSFWLLLRQLPRTKQPRT